MAGFNSVSPFYDQLAFLVFRNTLSDATKHFLHSIKPDQQVLVLGGGNGKILTWLDECNIPLKVTYVELSENMMRRSEAKQPFNNIRATFIRQDALALNHVNEFDVVITPFFLDCFSNDQLVHTSDRWSNLLRSGGTWIFTDFVKGSRLQILVPIMYTFFRLTAGLQVRKLPDYDILFGPDRFNLEQHRSFYSGLIETRLYRKL